MNPHQRHPPVFRHSLLMSPASDDLPDQIGAQLRVVYQEMLYAPPPEHFVLLLERLDAFSRNRAVATAPPKPY